MIKESEIKEIRSFLEKAENPLFFFDDDPDGLTSYLLLKKHYKKGHGVCIKASPNSSGVYYAAVSKHKPDLVVILDKPLINQEIIDLINTPIVWLDHHQPVERKGVNYYNPMNGEKPDNRPTCYWAYKVVEENEWVAVAGIIADWHVPEKEIVDKFGYKKLLGGYKTPPELLFESEYGKIVKILSSALKGTTESMNDCVESLEKINNPMEILERTSPNGKKLFDKFEKINKEYQVLLDDALSKKEDGAVFVYTYPGGKNSYTGGLSNELLYRVANEVVIVGREKDGEVRMSLRSKKKPILLVLKRALEEVEGYGGGHANACGASVKMDDFPRFLKFIRKEFES